MNRKVGILLSTGILTFGVGLEIMLLPLQVPSLPLNTWFVFYWCGGALVMLGGLIVDVTLLRTVARLLATIGGVRPAVRAFALTATGRR